MAADIGCEGDVQAEHLGDFVKMFVVSSQCGVILSVGLSDICACDDREEIRAVGGGVSVDEIAHLGQYAYFDMAARLSAFVDKAAPTDIFMSEVGEVDEGQSTGTETEDEDVA